MLCLRFRPFDPPPARLAMSIHLRLAVLLAALIAFPALAPPLAAQETLERTPSLSGGWTAYPGLLYVNLPYRFTTVAQDGRQIQGLPTFEFGMGLPLHLLAGARFALQSPTVPGRPNEWELFLRSAPLSEARGDALEVAASLAFNGAAESADGELLLARWFGPVRLIGALRPMLSAYGTDQSRIAVVGGAVVHPLPGGIPIAVAADVASLTDRQEGERVAWSVGLQLGLSFTDHTLSLFATNTSTSTLQGLSRGDERVRYGFEFTVPIPVGRFLGWHLPREEAIEAVVGEPEQAERVVQAEASRYLFLPKVIEIQAGTTIEWTNTDAVVHTVSADNGAWNSGAIPTGQTWQATFTRPGSYPFHCGPHPFMKGVVIVR